MSVDTAAMRVKAKELEEEGYEREFREILRSAADELDERERIIEMLKRRDKELAGIIDNGRAAHLETRLRLDQMTTAHEATKRELEATRTMLSASVAAHDMTRARLESAETLLRRMRWLRSNNEETQAEVLLGVDAHFARFTPGGGT